MVPSSSYPFIMIVVSTSLINLVFWMGSSLISLKISKVSRHCYKIYLLRWDFISNLFVFMPPFKFVFLVSILLLPLLSDYKRWTFRRGICRSFNIILLCKKTYNFILIQSIHNPKIINKINIKIALKAPEVLMVQAIQAYKQPEW